MYELLACLIEICDWSCPESKKTKYDSAASSSNQIPVVIAQPIMIRNENNINKKHR